MSTSCMNSIRQKANEKAKLNGLNGEKVFMNFFSNKEYQLKQINDIVDFVLRGQYIEVKTCQYYINDFTHLNVLRRGRFTLNKEQHDFLLSKNGYYYFILMADKILMSSKFVKAKDIEFKTPLVWTKIFGDLK